MCVYVHTCLCVHVHLNSFVHNTSLSFYFFKPDFRNVGLANEIFCNCIILNKTTLTFWNLSKLAVQCLLLEGWAQQCGRAHSQPLSPFLLDKIMTNRTWNSLGVCRCIWVSELYFCCKFCVKLVQKLMLSSCSCKSLWTEKNLLLALTYLFLTHSPFLKSCFSPTPWEFTLDTQSQTQIFSSPWAFLE